MHACAACESKRKKRDACFVCSLCLSGYVSVVFSEDVGWLAIFVWRSPSGVEKDGKCVKRRATIRYGVEPGGKLVSPWWKMFTECCSGGARFRACPRRPRHRIGRGAARLRRRVARRSAACPPATPGCHTGAAARAAGRYRRRASSRACAILRGPVSPVRGWPTR